MTTLTKAPRTVLLVLLLSLAPDVAFAWFLKGPAKTVSTAAVLGGAGAVGAAVAYWNRSAAVASRLYTPAPNSLATKTVLITGASTGLGLESAKRLAVGGANLILTARSKEKGQAAVDQVRQYLVDSGIPAEQQQDVSFQLVDLDNLDSVRQAANWNIGTKIDVLLNNAGIMALPERELTVDGFEKQMQSNHLGHFALTAVLAPKLSEKARIINVSSTAHTFARGGLLFDYMWKADSDYGAWKSYGQSKLANIFFTQELQRRIERSGLGWTALTLHPGVVGTDLGRNMMGPEKYAAMKEGNGSLVQTTLMKVMAAFLKTPEQGATTQIWLASAAATEVTGGQYYIDCKARGLSDFATDQAAQERLWKESEQLSGVEFNVGAAVSAKTEEEETTVAA
jgi:NAD(P)-dependent dehydrogenase (short-subunit alcohol dehydrogenase family)